MHSSALPPVTGHRFLCGVTTVELTLTDKAVWGTGTEL